MWKGQSDTWVGYNLIQAAIIELISMRLKTLKAQLLNLELSFKIFYLKSKAAENQEIWENDKFSSFWLFLFLHLNLWLTWFRSTETHILALEHGGRAIFGRKNMVEISVLSKKLPFQKNCWWSWAIKVEKDLIILLLRYVVLLIKSHTKAWCCLTL